MNRKGTGPSGLEKNHRFHEERDEKCSNHFVVVVVVVVVVVQFLLVVDQMMNREPSVLWEHLWAELM